jgi:predicted membrane-bound spermidine synthase
MLIAVWLAEGLVAFCALAFEVVAARLLAPHVGMSTDTWTSIIGAFLFAMALGNRIGGSLAANGDVRFMLRCAVLAVAAGGLAVAAAPVLIAPWDALILAPAPSSFWRVVLFAAVPCIPAGMMFGIATPLLMMSVVTVTGGRGRVIGAMYAAGAAGSVAGVLAALWVMLDGLGVRASLEMIGAMSLVNALLIVAVAMHLRTDRAAA